VYSQLLLQQTQRENYAVKFRVTPGRASLPEVSLETVKTGCLQTGHHSCHATISVTVTLKLQ